MLQIQYALAVAIIIVALYVAKKRRKKHVFNTGILGKYNHNQNVVTDKEVLLAENIKENYTSQKMDDLFRDTMADIKKGHNLAKRRNTLVIIDLKICFGACYQMLSMDLGGYERSTRESLEKPHLLDMIMSQLDKDDNLDSIVLMGYEGYRGRDNRLVVDGNGFGWIADLSPEGVPGLRCKCNARRLRPYYVPKPDKNTKYMYLAVDSYAAVAMSLLPGTFCMGSYHNVDNEGLREVIFCQIKNMWLISRKMVEIDTIVSPRERTILRKKYPTYQGVLLECTSTLDDIKKYAYYEGQSISYDYLCSLMKKIVKSDAKESAVEIFNSSYYWLIKELLLQGIFYKHAYSVLGRPNDLSGIDIYDRHYISGVVYNVVIEVPSRTDVDETIELWYKECLGSLDNEKIAFPIKYTAPLNRQEHYAVSLDSVNNLKSGEKRNGLIGRDYWALDIRLKTEANLMGNGKHFIVEILNSTQILCYTSKEINFVRKILSKVKSVQIMGSGAEVDLSELGNRYSQEKSVNTLNEMIGGEFGTEGVLFALQNIFRGNLEINIDSPITSFIPKSALSNKGIKLTSFMPAHIISNAAFMSDNGNMYWIPGEGLNRFKMKLSTKDRMVHMVEDICYKGEPNTTIGCIDIPFKVG